MRFQRSSILIYLMGMLASFLIASYFAGLFGQINHQIEYSQSMDVVERVAWVVETHVQAEVEGELAGVDEFDWEAEVNTALDWFEYSALPEFEIVLLAEEGDRIIFEKLSDKNLLPGVQVASVINNQILVFNFYDSPGSIGLDTLIPIMIFAFGSLSSLVFALVYQQNSELRRYVLMLYEV